MENGHPSPAIHTSWTNLASSWTASWTFIFLVSVWAVRWYLTKQICTHHPRLGSSYLVEFNIPCQNRMRDYPHHPLLPLLYCSLHITHWNKQFRPSESYTLHSTQDVFPLGDVRLVLNVRVLIVCNMWLFFFLINNTTLSIVCGCVFVCVRSVCIMCIVVLW